MAKIEQLTVMELYKALGQEIKKGNGQKKLVTADDNEGNGYHGIFYAVTPMDANSIDLVYDSQEMNPANLMIVG